ncbi:MAG: alpha/beta hydrolase [Isosphaeraceae bacterium]
MDRGRRAVAAGLILHFLIAFAALPAGADRVRMRNDLVYEGLVQHDETIVTITDDLRRIIVRDGRVAKIDKNAVARTSESFLLEQPIEVRSAPASLPSIVLGVQAGPFDAYGQRPFSYLNSKQKALKLTQAIVEMTPHHVKLRGINGPWMSTLALEQVPRAIIQGLLGRVEQENENERRRVIQFMIQAGWYAEAREELDRLAKDFADAGELARGAQLSVVALEAARDLREIDRALQARQPKTALLRLRSFQVEGVEPDVLGEVRTRLRKVEDQDLSARRLAESLRKSVGDLPETSRGNWPGRLLTILQAASEAPDVASSRLEAFAKAQEESGLSDEAKLARAFSGWAIGPDRAVSDLAVADTLWAAAEGVQAYLASRPEADRGLILRQLEALSWPDPNRPGEARSLDPDLATRMARLLPPPRAGEADLEPGRGKLIRVLDDDNPAPTEYAVLLPPEYHPLRSYPMLVALHDGKGPMGALEYWGVEASRRGYIVIAPEYLLPGATVDYRYTSSEHAAITLAIRDARKRFAIDGDRVYLAGLLLGGNGAWDYGLAHHDQFAAMAVVNGIPGKYVGTIRSHAKFLPTLNILGDLVPGANELILPFGKDLMVKNFDYTHVEYTRRGLEPLPEENPAIFDWLEKWKRPAPPRAFKGNSARATDDRFFGVVVRELLPGRTIEPEAADMLGNNIPRPPNIEVTISPLANLVQIKTDGIKRLDYWVGPEALDFSKRMEVRVNGKAMLKGNARPELADFLEDLRVRADRQQTYWLKVAVR